MDKQNALQDINYIRQIMSETQQVFDITWPVYIYWGLEIIVSFVLSSFFINYEEIKRGGITLSLIMDILIEISLWGGFAGTAIYAYFHREKIINQKMFLIGTIGISFILIKLIEIIGFRLIITSTGYNEVSTYFSTLLNGTYFASLFIILGLVYAREQLWLGYSLLIVTLLSMYFDIYYSKSELFGITLAGLGFLLTWMSVGICFLTAGIMAYRRHRQQLNENQQVIVQE